MKLHYYSYYPYKDPNCRIEDTPEGDMFTQPFRLYKSAECYSLTDFKSEEDFINACYEAMDRPECRIVDYREGEPYKDTKYGVEVIPAKHFYGATNVADGVFVTERGQTIGVLHFYVKLLDKVISTDWDSAVLKVFRRNQRQYLTNLIDFWRL